MIPVGKLGSGGGSGRVMGFIRAKRQIEIQAHKYSFKIEAITGRDGAFKNSLASGKIKSGERV